MFPFRYQSTLKAATQNMCLQFRHFFQCQGRTEHIAITDPIPFISGLPITRLFRLDRVDETLKQKSNAYVFINVNIVFNTCYNLAFAFEF